MIKFKRFFDLVTSAVLIILLIPLFIIIITLSFFIQKEPVFFIQVRPGLNGKLFKLYKFRTMRNVTDKNGNLLSDKERTTKFGLFLRKTSLDELPQLFNIFKGDMSFVGPRPLLQEYLSWYNDFQKRRHEVKPGLTGLVQVNGRNNLSWDERFKLDIWYVENWSFLLDIKILLKTVFVVLKREGTNSSSKIIMEKGRKKV